MDSYAIYLYGCGSDLAAVIQIKRYELRIAGGVRVHDGAAVTKAVQ